MIRFSRQDGRSWIEFSSEDQIEALILKEMAEAADKGSRISLVESEPNAGRPLVYTLQIGEKNGTKT